MPNVGKHVLVLLGGSYCYVGKVVSDQMFGFFTMMTTGGKLKRAIKPRDVYAIGDLATVRKAQKEVEAVFIKKSQDWLRMQKESDESLKRIKETYTKDFDHGDE